MHLRGFSHIAIASWKGLWWKRDLWLCDPWLQYCNRREKDLSKSASGTCAIDEKDFIAIGKKRRDLWYHNRRGTLRYAILQSKKGRGDGWLFYAIWFVGPNSLKMIATWFLSVKWDADRVGNGLLQLELEY